MDPAVVLNVGVALAVATLGSSLLLAFVSAVSWARLRRAKVGVAGGAFLLLALKGAIATSRALDEGVVDLPQLALDFGVLVFLFASVAMR